MGRPGTRRSAPGEAGPAGRGLAIRTLTTRAAEALPSWLSESLRALVLAWGRLTSRWRAEPDFIVIGAQRAGTTTLFRLLSEHPEIERPVVSKGVGYFDLNYHRGPSWYRAHFPTRPLLRLRTRDGRRPLVFESSGYYLFHPLAAARIARDLPQVRLVALARDPVERAWSAHKHECARGFEDLDFREALEREPQRLRGERERLLADPRAQSHHHRYHAYLGRSRYAEQLRVYLGLVGPERVYVMDADRFFADPVEEFTRLQEWLGVTPVRPHKVQRWNARPSAPVEPDLREQLLRRFEADDQELAEILGRTPSWRSPAPESSEPSET